MIKDASGNWLGKIQIHATEEAEISMLFQKIQGAGIEIDGMCAVVEVQSDFVKDARLGSNI